MTCRVSEETLNNGVRMLRLENELLATTVLLDKGADIYELIYKPRGVDVLWKSPWGMKAPGRGPSMPGGSEVVWLEHYAGGWQELFPNGGDACTYKGVELAFHGEASMVLWDYEIVDQSTNAVEVRLETRLKRSPFLVERYMRVEAGQPALIIRGRVTNEAGESMDYMWSHHPAYGAPFLSEACRIDVGTQSFRADDGYAGAYSPLMPGESYQWPNSIKGDITTDLSRIPDQNTRRDMLAYFENFDSGWYAITNPDLGFGVGLVWPKEVYPYAWFWQEMHANPGFPFYQNCYVMAIEPASSIPGQGLVNVMEKTGVHGTLGPGESAEVDLRAVFYESKAGVEGIDADGQVALRD